MKLPDSMIVEMNEEIAQLRRENQSLRVSLEAAKADSERLDFVESQRQTLWASQGAPTTESWCVMGPEGSSFRDNVDAARASRSGQGETA